MTTNHALIIEIFFVRHSFPASFVKLVTRIITYLVLGFASGKRIAHHLSKPTSHAGRTVFDLTAAIRSSLAGLASGDRDGWNRRWGTG
jgi:hypothetical protein